MKLETNRLLLRKMQDDDAISLFTIWSDPIVTEHMNISAFKKVDQATEMIRYLNKLAEDHQAIRYSVILQHSGEVIGSCGFNHFDFANQKAEIGYELAYEHWGNGYAQEAINCLTNYGFKELDLNRIEAKVAPENTSSVKLLQRLAFTYEGTLRQAEKYDGMFHDLSLYSKLIADS